jgi:hypothetical protein
MLPTEASKLRFEAVEYDNRTRYITKKSSSPPFNQILKEIQIKKQFTEHDIRLQIAVRVRQSHINESDKLFADRYNIRDLVQIEFIKNIAKKDGGDLEKAARDLGLIPSN